MHISRRNFTAGALGAAFAGRAFALASPALDGALAAIRAYADEHVRYFGLPGLTLGISAPGGFSAVIDSGFADPASRRPITPDTLFQIGSISKSMTAALLHQFAAEGRLGLNGNFARLMPELPLPPASAFTVQHVLDHVAGLPGDAPLFPAGGLWTAYPPGAHWHYSNTGYDMLGKLAAHIGGKPIDQLLAERIFTPLGMTRTRGAIIGADRPLYAQGYEAADMVRPYRRGAPLAPAAWVDVTFAAGSIASTAADMTNYLRSMASAAAGRGGFGLTPQQGLAFTSHFVPSDDPAMRYGNGIERVADEGRAYLHHTGGMVSFSSAYHVDPLSGVGAFASSNLSGLLGYRPRKLSLYAVKAVTAALAGRPLPKPSDLAPPPADYADLVGGYSGPAGSFEVRGGRTLTIYSGGQSALLEATAKDLFVTDHPAFATYALQFDRQAGKVVSAGSGNQLFRLDGAAGKLPQSDPAVARLAGRYVNDSPWLQAAVVVERGGRLFVGADEVFKIGDNRWRPSPDIWSPERMSFSDFIDGRPQTLNFSGEKFLRHDI